MPEVELNLAELKTLVSQHAQAGQVLDSVRRDSTFVFAGFGKYQGKYRHHAGKRVLLLDIKLAGGSRRISLFFELLLQLVNALLRGERVTTRNFDEVMVGVSKNGRELQYPDPRQHKACYLTTALFIFEKTGRSDPYAVKTAGIAITSVRHQVGEQGAAANAHWPQDSTGAICPDSPKAEEAVHV